MEDGSVHQMSNMDWMLRRSQSLPSKTVSRCHERVQLWLGDKYPTGAHYTGGGGEVAKVTRRHGQGLEGLLTDLGNCMRYPQAALQEHDGKSRGQAGASSERVPDLWHPLSLRRKEMMRSQKVASTFDQQPTARVVHWGAVVKEGLANSLIEKKWTRLFYFCFVLFCPRESHL